MTAHLATNVLWLAADTPNRDPNGPEFGKSSPLALLMILLLLVVTAALIWSMTRHLKKLPESFDPEHPAPDQAADDGTDFSESELRATDSADWEDADGSTSPSAPATGPGSVDPIERLRGRQGD